MALVTHQIQGSYVTLPSRPMLIKGMKVKRCLATCHMIGRTEMSYLVKRNVSLSFGASFKHRQKPRALRILAFKGHVQNEESGGRASGPKTSKNSVRLKETDDPTKESQSGNDISLSFNAEVNENVSPSSAIRGLFMKWLAHLRTQPSDEVLDGILEEESSSPVKNLETEVGIEKKERHVVIKAVWSHFLSLPAVVKIPLLIFIPAYLACNVVYGSEVSKELTPFWVVGPIVLGFYVKLLSWLFSLYAFAFRLTIEASKKLPSLIYTFLFQGQLKALIRTHLAQPLRSINKERIQIWAKEAYLDFIESVWPIYCKIIRFLKNAKLI